MCPRGFSLGIAGTFLNLKRQKHKKNKTRHTQTPASQETNWFTIQGKAQQSLPLSNRVPHFNTKQIGLFWRKKFPLEMTYPTVWNPAAPTCWFLAPTAKLWGSWCCFGEFEEKILRTSGPTAARVLPQNSLTGAGWLGARRLLVGFAKIGTAPLTTGQ